MTDTFDPRRVPPFPVVNITLRDDDTVTVDGRPVDVGLDDSPKDAGIQAAAMRTAELGLTSARVRAVGPDGIHLMVVTIDGDIYPLDDAPLVGPARKPRRALGIALASAVVVVAAGAGFGLWALTNASATPAPTAVSTPGAGANLPVVAPPGYGQTATWSVEVEERTPPLLIATDRIAVLTNNGRFQILDTASGATVWQAQGRPSLRGGFHATSVAGVPVLATNGSEGITVWPLDAADAGVVAAVTYPTEPRASVSYLGSAPLADLGDQTVQVIDSDGILQLDVPVTATPVLATSTEVVAYSDSSLWRIPFSGTPQESSLPSPATAVGAPQAVTATGEAHLLVLWPTATSSTSVVALIDINAGTIVTEATVPSRAFTGDDAPIHSVDADTMVVGNLFVDYTANPAVLEIDDVDVDAVNGSTVYGISGGQAVAASRTGESFSIQVFTTNSTGGTTPPLAVTNGQAFVVTEKVRRSFLYALPHKD